MLSTPKGTVQGKKCDVAKKKKKNSLKRPIKLVKRQITVYQWPSTEQTKDTHELCPSLSPERGQGLG